MNLRYARNATHIMDVGIHESPLGGSGCRIHTSQIIAQCDETLGSAHRSLDWPNPEDGPSVQELHTWSVSSPGGHLFHPKPGTRPLVAPTDLMNPYRRWIEHYHCFQLRGDGKHDTLNLSIEREHPVFIEEAYQLIATLLSKP